MKIIVGARTSPLSRAQFREVEQEIKSQCPDVEFEGIFLKTHGDQDLNTSIRSLEKTDFFTREIDELLLAGKCRIAIHSAKDLPDPLPGGLEIAALTKGVDSSDALVFREGDSLSGLPPGSIIATSSHRREDVVRLLRPDLRFVDLRGTIHQRLEKLNSKEADGIVIAEAALIRLGLTYLNRIQLPGETTQHQGKLAIVIRSGDQEMLTLFSAIDSRQMASP